MKEPIIFVAGDSPALTYAARFLGSAGVKLGRENATHTLLNVPSAGGEILPNTTVIGGNLDFLPPDIPKIDLLKDEFYIAENAQLTADCTVRLLGQHLPCQFRDCPILVIGWGRIGKCLCAMLKALDARVFVAARKETDRAMVRALGYGAVAMEDMGDCKAIINTAPSPVLPAGDGLRIDLASSRGIAGENVIWARGLPGKMLPESSGKLIAQAILRHFKEGKL